VSKQQKIALDCMGGDRAPQIVIEGADIVAEKNQSIKFLLFGDSDKITPIIHNCRFLKGRYEIIHTKNFVSSEDKPSAALRNGKDTSMHMAITSVKEGKADVVVSAGNTGALMAMSKLILRPLPTISRPAIVSSIPNMKKGGTVMLDLGANIDCNSEILFQFAVMGHAFAKAVFKMPNPKIGLLNIGSEELKGHQEIQKTADMLKNCSVLQKDYYGYVEGNDITKGTTDVVVADGFSGNIALKSIEGTAKLITTILKEAFTTNIWSKLGYLLSGIAINKTTKTIDPRSHNGAMFVGLNGVVVKSHGNTDKIGFANSINVAISLVENNINEEITKELELALKNISITNQEENDLK